MAVKLQDKNGSQLRGMLKIGRRRRREICMRVVSFEFSLQLFSPHPPTLTPPSHDFLDGRLGSVRHDSAHHESACHDSAPGLSSVSVKRAVSFFTTPSQVRSKRSETLVP